MKRMIVCIACFVVVVSCTDALELDKVGLVTKFHVLAVQAEPAEPRPGQGVTLSALWADPKGKGRDVWFAWLICARWMDPNGDLSSCDPMIPPQVDKAQNRGHIFEVPNIPEDILDDLPEGDDFLDATVVILMCAGGTLPSAKEIASRLDVRVPSRLCEGGEGMTVFKNMRISQSASPNANPVIERLKCNGEVLEPADTGNVGSVTCKDVDACEAEINVALAEESRQQFEILDSGKTKLIDEALYVSWFVNGGELDLLQSGADDPVGPYTVHWHLDGENPLTLWAVAHDTRGGVSWRIVTVQARQLP